MKCIAIALISLGFVGCISKSDKVLNLFSVFIYAEGEVILSEPELLTPVEVYITGSGDLLLTEPTDNFFSAIFDTLQNSLLRFCPIGQGPEEHLPPLFFSRDKSLNTASFFSPRSSKFFTYEISTKDTIAYEIKSIYRDFENSNKVLLVNDSLFLSTPLFNTSEFPHRYSLRCKKGNLIYSGTPYPKNRSQKIPVELMPIAFQSNMASNPKSMLVASACLYKAHFEILSVGEEGITRIAELNLSDGMFEDYSVGELKSIKPTQSNVIAFISVDATENFIYTLYSGRTIHDAGRQDAFKGDRILMFDWEGNPIKCINLDRDIFNFSIFENTIYAIGIENHIPILLRFNI